MNSCISGCSVDKVFTIRINGIGFDCYLPQVSDDQRCRQPSFPKWNSTQRIHHGNKRERPNLSDSRRAAWLHHLQFTKERIQEEWPELSRDKEIQRRIATCELVRNRFLIGAFSGLRVSDFSRLGEMNIVNGLILLRTRKTDTPIAIPVHPVIQEIIDRGFDLNKTISDQKMNTYNKRLARMAQIDEKVAKREHRGGAAQVRCTEKYNLVSTHTARRSFATNLLKAKDVSLAAISKALGHSKITTTMRYLRVGLEENASILAGSSYFNMQTEDD